MGDVQIWVKDCKDLPMIRGAAIDPFVKWYVNKQLFFLFCVLKGNTIH